jgi:hypothetical protein
MKLLKWRFLIIAVFIVGLAVFTVQLPIAMGRASIQVVGQHFTSYTYEGIQHIVFIGPGNHIDELYYGQNLNSGQRWHTDLTQTAANDGIITAASESALVGYSDTTQHVIFIGSDGDLHEFWSTGNPVTWKDTDLTKTVNGISDPASGCPLVGYIWQGMQHIIYIGSDNHIDELYNTGQWTFDDLTGSSNPSAASGSGLVGYVWQVDNTQHVIYIDSNNHIQELWSTGQPGPWKSTDLIDKTGAPEAGSQRALAGYAVGTQEHVIYIDTNTHVHELLYDSPNQLWSNNDLTNAANANSPASGSTLVGYSDTTQHVIFLGSNGHIQELWNPSGSTFWQQHDLTTAATDSIVAEPETDLIGYIWLANGTQHVIYTVGGDKVRFALVE